MDLQVRLLIHGVPFGQKMWGDADELYKQYISTLYNPADNLTRELLKVDKIGQKAYYSYIKCGNVADNNGRAGSYFGLTLVMNAYYADMQNIYGILRAVYEKLCVGVYVSDNGRNIKFIVADFAASEQKSREIKKQTIQVVGTFSSNSDFSPLSGLPQSNGNYAQINLQACASATALQAMRSNGCLKVSPYYPSPESSRLKAENEQKLREASLRHNSELQSQKRQYEAQISQLQNQISQKENEMRGGKKSLQDKIDQLIQRLSGQENQHKSECDKLKSRLQEVEKMNNEIIISLRNLVSRFGRGAMPQGKEPEDDKKDGKEDRVRSFFKEHFDFPFIVLLFIVLGAVGWTQNRNLMKLYARQGEQLEMLVAAITPQDSDSVAAFSDLKIDVEGDGYDNGRIKEGFIDVTLIDANDNRVDSLDGDWEVEGLEAVSGHISSDNPNSFHFVDDDGIDTVRISYTVDGKEVVSQKYPVEHEKN